MSMRSDEKRLPVYEIVEALAQGVRNLHGTTSDELREGAADKKSVPANRGALASLRRMDWETAGEAAFYRLLMQRLPDASVPHEPWDMRRYALLVKILALPTDKTILVGSNTKLGAVMGRKEPGSDQPLISPHRVQVLMTAEGPHLYGHLLRLSRRLVQLGKLPYLEIGYLILGGPDMVERTRFAIARAYWTKAERAPDPESPTDTPTGDL